MRMVDIPRLYLTIYGHMPRKSNQRAPKWRKRPDGRTVLRIEKSDKAKDWTEAAIMQVNKQRVRWEKDNDFTLPFMVPCILSADIYYRNQQSDLSDELLADMLQKAGIIKDDNLLRVKHLFWYHDKDMPRVVCWIEPVEPIGPYHG